MELTLQTLEGKIRPVMAKFDCRMIEVCPTSQEPMRGFTDRMMALEAHSELSSLSELGEHIPGDPGVLSVSCVHGFMAADVAEMGSQMLVVTDGSIEKAKALSEQLGMELFELRGSTRPEYLTIDEAIDACLATADPGNQPGPAVIADVWDNAGGGSAGDSTYILRRLIERNVKGAALAGIWDPIAVEFCHQAGAGTSLPLRFGGKTSGHTQFPPD